MISEEKKEFLKMFADLVRGKKQPPKNKNEKKDKIDFTFKDR